MQELDTFIEETPLEELDVVEQPEVSPVPVVSVLDMPVARLQIVQTGEVMREGYPTRPDVEPTLAQNSDGLWLITVRRQGEHGKFGVPYIGSEILLADAEMGFVVVLVAYHGTETYGRKRDKHVSKGQFYRFYRQIETGEWQRQNWQKLNDETRQMVLGLEKPEWARKPGKLSSERKPPAKMVEMVSYKVVRVIGGRYYSLYKPDVEYVLGQRMKQPARPGHAGGYFTFPTSEMGVKNLEIWTHCLPFHDEIETPELALLECEIGGKVISYGHKLCSTYLCPIRVIKVVNRDSHAHCHV